MKARRLGSAGSRFRSREGYIIRYLSRTSRGMRHYSRVVLADEPRRDGTPTNARKMGRVLDVVEVAELVGASPRTVRRWIHSGALPARRKGIKGSMFRVRRENLAAFLR